MKQNDKSSAVGCLILIIILFVMSIVLASCVFLAPDDKSKDAEEEVDLKKCIYQ